MAKRKIVYYPEPVLTVKAPEVETIDGEIAELMDDMAETMYASHGIGLAAPQIAVSKRVITVDVNPDSEEITLMQLANPRILEGHGRVLYEEGCLSFPGLTVEVARQAEIHVEAVNRDGETFRFEADGLLAICVQHEIDHLDGITFVDHLNPLRRRVALRRFKHHLAAMLAQNSAA